MSKELADAMREAAREHERRAYALRRDARDIETPRPGVTIEFDRKRGIVRYVKTVSA